MSPLRVLPVLGMATFFAACHVSASDDAVGAAESDVTKVPGSSLGSAYADPAKTYLRRRNVRNLGAASTLDRATLELAERVDGVLANKPKDGFITVDELVAMEQPPQSTALFPNEKAALPLIWGAMEVGPVATSVKLAGAPPGDMPLKDRITTTLGPPSPMVVSKVAIALLPYDLTKVAARIELVHDDDADPNTISPDDIADAKANPAPFTASEIALLGRIVDEQRARGVSTASAKLVLPYDGVVEERYGKAGRFEIVRSRRLELEETRSTRDDRTIGVELNAEETVDDWLLVDGTEAIVDLFSTTTDDEFLVGSGFNDAISRVPAGHYLAQVWRKGGLGPFAREGAPCATDGQIFERTCGQCGYAQAVCLNGQVETYGVCKGEQPGCFAGSPTSKTLTGWFEIELGPNAPPANVPDYQRTVKLRPFADYDVVTAAGAPVTKWLGYAVTASHTAQWTFGPFDPDHVGKKELTAGELAAMATPKPSLPVGRYDLDDALPVGHFLDVYPNNIVVFVTPQGTTRRLMPVTTESLITDAINNEVGLTLNVKTGEVTANKPYGYPKTIKLRAADRL